MIERRAVAALVLGVFLGFGLTACGGESQQADAAAGAAAGPAEPAQRTGEQVYFKSCFSCHAAGIADAPKVGDAEAWAVVAAKGMDALLETTKTGIPPGMPAMGLCLDCTDEELVNVIKYMLDNSQP